MVVDRLDIWLTKLTFNVKNISYKLFLFEIVSEKFIVVFCQLSITFGEIMCQSLILNTGLKSSALGLGINVEKILKSSLVSILSPSSSVKDQIMGRKFAWDRKAKYYWESSTNFLFSKVCWQHAAMFCLYTSSKLSRP